MDVTNPYRRRRAATAPLPGSCGFPTRYTRVFTVLGCRNSARKGPLVVVELMSCFSKGLSTEAIDPNLHQQMSMLSGALHKTASHTGSDSDALK